MTLSSADGIKRSTASHWGSDQLKSLDGSSLTFTGTVSHRLSYRNAAA